jgi:hypothetical protein
MWSKINMNKINIDKQLPLPALLLSIERQIYTFVNEVCFVFDSDKNLILNKQGDVNFIRFTQEELNLLEDKYFTHNHPKNGFFSVTDIEFAHAWNLQEMRVVTEKEVYIINRPSDGWNEPQLIQQIKQEKEPIKMAYFQGEISKTQADKLYHEQMPKNLLQKLGIALKTIKLWD